MEALIRVEVQIDDLTHGNRTYAKGDVLDMNESRAKFLLEKHAVAATDQPVTVFDEADESDGKPEADDAGSKGKKKPAK